MIARSAFERVRGCEPELSAATTEPGPGNLELRLPGAHDGQHKDLPLKRLLVALGGLSFADAGSDRGGLLLDLLVGEADHL